MSSGMIILSLSLTKHENLYDLLDSNDFDVLAFDSISEFFSDSDIKRRRE